MKIADHIDSVRGKIRGTYTEEYFSELRQGYIVELDEGFYDPNHQIFVRLLPVHADNLRPAREEE